MTCTNCKFQYLYLFGGKTSEIPYRQLHNLQSLAFPSEITHLSHLHKKVSFPFYTLQYFKLSNVEIIHYS